RGRGRRVCDRYRRGQGNSGQRRAYGEHGEICFVHLILLFGRTIEWVIGASAATLWSSGFLLFGEDRMEHGLLDVHLDLAAGSVDERIPAAVPDLRVFLFHAVL